MLLLMVIQYPPRMPETGEEFLASMEVNFAALVDLAPRKVMGYGSSLSFNDIRAKFKRGEKKHGPWAPFKVIPVDELLNEVKDLLVYLWWLLLQLHFSRLNAERQ